MYDALDEYHLEHDMPDALWARLLNGVGKDRVHRTEIPHNALIAMKKMELVKINSAGYAFLTGPGLNYARLIVAPPF